MQIQINTDKNIQGTEDFANQVQSVVEHNLSHFTDRITRVEVHLSDQSGDKHSHDDKRCMMEARLEGRRPIAVTHQAGTLDEAISGAADKLKVSIESMVGRLAVGDRA